MGTGKLRIPCDTPEYRAGEKKTRPGYAGELQFAQIRGSRQPNCLEEKEKAIEEALKHFKMIES